MADIPHVQHTHNTADMAHVALYKTASSDILYFLTSMLKGD